MKPRANVRVPFAAIAQSEDTRPPRLRVQENRNMLRKLINPILDRTSPQAWARIHTGRRLRVDMNNTVGKSIWLRKRYEPEI